MSPFPWASLLLNSSTTLLLAWQLKALIYSAYSILRLLLSVIYTYTARCLVLFNFVKHWGLESLWDTQCRILQDWTACFANYWFCFENVAPNRCSARQTWQERNLKWNLPLPHLQLIMWGERPYAKSYNDSHNGSDIFIKYMHVRTCAHIKSQSWYGLSGGTIIIKNLQ